MVALDDGSHVQARSRGRVCSWNDGLVRVGGGASLYLMLINGNSLPDVTSR
jgi:hypothetical protein